MELKPEKERYYLSLEYDYITWKPRIKEVHGKTKAARLCKPIIWSMVAILGDAAATVVRR